MSANAFAEFKESLIQRKRVLITVKTYPLPSRKHDELVCTAGLDSDGHWVRIYPVPFRFLKEERKFRKYQWIKIDLQRRLDDFRPESYRPVHYALTDLEFAEYVDTRGNWAERRRICCREGQVYLSMKKLIADSRREASCRSLATFKPTRIIDFLAEEVDREWKDEWRWAREQKPLFEGVGWDPDSGRPPPVDKLPYKFSYRFEDENGKRSTLMIEDWEIGALYWNCLRRSGYDEQAAIAKVRAKYLKEFSRRDIHLFLGTTLQWHRRRATNPFVIVGVFYPPADFQQPLF